MKRYLPYKAHDNSEDGHYWISISDLMVSLLFIFILILVYTIASFNEQTEILAKKSQAFEENFNSRRDLLVSVQKSLKDKNIDVDIDPENGNLRIRSDGFFTIGSADLNPEGQAKMVAIANDIKTKLKQNPKYQKAIDTIFIEGHTDNVQINSSNYGRRWTNMELSAQRAINTFLIMDNGTKIGEMKNQNGRYLFSYSGYADQRPILENNSDINRAKNRRIEIFFALNTPKIEKPE